MSNVVEDAEDEEEEEVDCEQVQLPGHRDMMGWVGWLDLDGLRATQRTEGEEEEWMLIRRQSARSNLRAQSVVCWRS